MEKIKMTNTISGDLKVEYITQDTGEKITYTFTGENAEYVKNLSTQELIDFIDEVNTDSEADTEPKN